MNGIRIIRDALSSCFGAISESGKAIALENALSHSMSTKTGKFVTGSVLSHIVVMTLSSGGGLLAIFLVDLADLYFISLLGKDALAAAVGYAGTLLFFFTSISIGLAIAMGALTARALGTGDEERSRRIAGSVAAIIVVLGVISTIVILAFADPLLRMLGATGVAHEYAVSFLTIAAFGTPFLMMGMAGGALLRSHGDARRAMTTTLSAALINAILDPLLIFTAGLGLEGAAIATVIARITLFIVAWRAIVVAHDGFARPTLSSLGEDARAVFGIAGPAMLTNVATPVGFAFVTRMIAEFGTQAVAGYAVIGRLTPFAFCLVFGLSGAVGPIIGQNFGAGQWARVRSAMMTATGFVALYVLVVSFALYIFREPITGAFNTTGEAEDLVLLFCGPLALAFFFNAVLFTTNAAFNNLERPLYSTLLNWGRHTIGTVPFAWVGAQLYGAEGVLIGQYAGGAIFAILSLWLSLKLIDGHEAGAPPRKVGEMFAASRAAQWPFSNWRP